jgi:hypothetical protein
MVKPLYSQQMSLMLNCQELRIHCPPNHPQSKSVFVETGRNIQLSTRFPPDKLIQVIPRTVTRILSHVLWLASLCAAAGRAYGAESDPVDFNFQIRPLLSDRCYRCHGPDAVSRKGKLRLDTPEGALKELDDGWAVVKPGAPAKSELISRIFTDNEDDLMPPPDSHLKLTAAEKDLLKRWITEGATFQPHWAFLPVQPVTSPQLKQNATTVNPIDAFVLARLEKEKLQAAPTAPREILIRRLALNLTGLPPTPAEIDTFVADKSPDAMQRATQNYLNSPAYGERMALDWLDLARYADTYGYQADVERDMSPYRDWVIKAFNDNLSYDQFLIWQLAGDLLPNATREQRIATAFNRLHRQTNEGGSIEEEFRIEYAADRIHTVGTAMLGLTMECARCHDHKFDPIKQSDYFSMFAFFNNIDESGLYSHFTSATPTPTLPLWPEDQAKQHAALKIKIAAAEAKLETIARSATKEFESWRKTAAVKLPSPIARYSFDTVVSNTSPDSLSMNVAKLEDGPKLVLGAPVSKSSQPGAALETSALTNSALQFSGDNQAILKSVPTFLRTDPFSLTLWLNPAEKQNRAIILHQSKAWSDAGSRGFELTLEHGKPFFGLIHFWPGNAIAVRAKEVLPTNEWSHLTVTYDGSSRAAGIQIYRNGTPLETETIRDKLTKDISYSDTWANRYAKQPPLTLAARFRDSGFKNGAIDDVQVFAIALTEAEVRLVAAGGLPANTLDYFLTRHTETYRATLAELKQLRAAENQLGYEIPEIMVMEELPQPRVTHLLKRGAYDAPGEVVPRATPEWLLPFPKDQPRNRLGLARWMVDRKNPLTARVVVNRIWRMHFGRGLVATQDDFGSQGKLPTHPELLDWLAGWFMDNGWNVKALHQLIVSSETFQQSSQTDGTILERDPDNKLLTRSPKIRLLAEQIRDSALAASGLLNRQIGGPSVKPYQPAGLWEAAGTGKSYTQDTGDKLYRRSLYTFWRRTAPPPSMLTFDAMSREVCTAKRDATATPLQSLVLLNDPQFIEASRVLGEKLLKQFPKDEAARHREAFRALTGRTPDKTESEILARLYAEQKTEFTKNPDGAKKLLSAGESKRDETMPTADSAAMTTLVNAIMNFDEFVVQR